MDQLIGPQLAHAGLNLDREPRSARDRMEGNIFGFWIFLMSDAVVFALLSAIYGTMLGATAGAPGPSQEFKIDSAFIETLILLTSSFTFGMATLALKYGPGSGRVALWMSVTLLLGLSFLGMEFHDFSTMIHNGAMPSRSGFLSAFFVLVGMHGLHVTFGCLWIVIMLTQLRVYGADEQVKINILRLGLFWHFLDVIWIAIFSVVYLQGVMR